MVYRDGVGGPTLQEWVKKFEIEAMVTAINNVQAGYAPQIVYTLVDKMTTHRLFEKYNGNGMVNPAQGTLLDKGLVEL